MMNDSSQRSARITADDRAWFCRHPEAIVRFRPIRAHELKPLQVNGIEPPEFRPSWCKPSAALEQIAVIDLTRLLNSNQIENESGMSMRIRIATVRARSSKARQKLQQAIINATYRELLALHGHYVASEENTQPIRRKAA